MKVVAIIQARMGSSRLPGKVLADIHGRPMLKWLLDRVRSVQEIDEIVVATTDNPKDDPLELWVRNQNVACFRGSESDVLDRFFRCLEEGHAGDIIVRVTADDPLKDPGVIREAIKILLKNPAVDYCSNILKPTYPEGLDIEVFRHDVLVRAHREAQLPSEREHVTPYVWKNPDKFRLCSMEHDRDLSRWRWTVDKPEDLAFIRAICEEFKERPLTPFTEMIAYIEQNPQLLEINSGSATRNEGYLKSLAKENK